MRNLHRIIFQFVLILILNPTFANSIRFSKENLTFKTTTEDPTGQITGAATVCLNANNPKLTLEVINGINGPYTFTYKLSEVQQPDLTTVLGNSITIDVPTTTAGIFEYTLLSVLDKDNHEIALTTKTAIVTVNDLPRITGNFHTCIGSDSKLNSTETITSWTSSSPSIARIDDTGLVKGIAVGTTNITFINSNGCQNSLVFTVNPLTIASFTSNVTAGTCSGDFIEFKSNITTGLAPYSYEWDFGDGTTSTEANPVHSFTSLGCEEGSFLVKLIVKDSNECFSSIISNTISVKQKPKIEVTDLNPFSIDPFNNCSSSSGIGYLINVGNGLENSSCIQPGSISIDWGDGTSVSNVVFPITHNYTQLKAYNMVVSAVGINGCSNSKTYVVKNVSNPSGGISSPGNTQNLCAPTINLEFGISSWGLNSSDTTYEIDYGDNTPIITIAQAQLESSPYYDAVNPVKSANYPIPHSYTVASCPNSQVTVTLKITNACSSTPFTTSNVSILSKPNANFTSPPSQCVNSSVLFTNTTTAGFSQGCSQNSIYTWDFGDGTPIITTPLQSVQNISHTYTASGNYTVTMSVTGYCGTSTKTQQICIENKLTPSFTLNTNSGCTPLAVLATNTTLITNSCNTTYSWKATYKSSFCGSGAILIPEQTTQNASYNFVKPGTYSITLTTTNSCGSVTTPIQTVIVKQPPTVVINPIASNCVTTAITPSILVNSCSTLNSELNYLWTFNGGTPANSTSITPPLVSYDTPGDYSITLEVSNECGTTTATSNLFTINPKPVIQNETSFICSGSSFLITPSDLKMGNTIPIGTTYSWDAPTITAGITGGLPETNQTSIKGILTNNTNSVQTATYTVTPSTGNCIGTPFRVTINVDPQIAIATIVSPASCFGYSDASVTATATGGTAPYSYSWNTNPNQTTATISGLSMGDYTVTSTDANGCTQSQTISITQPVVLDSSIISQTNVSCFGDSNGSATVLATGGTAPYLYSWNTSPIQNTATATGLIAGIYTVSITDSKGCSKIQQVIISQPSATLDSSISTQTDIVCFGSSSGSATVIATGGTAPYSYSWNTSPVQTGSSATGLFAGNYSVTITDAKNCTKTQSVTITQPASGLTSFISSQTNLSCFGDNNGSATVAATGGFGTLSYSWNTTPVQTSATAIGLTAGTYSVIVTDQNGCSKNQQVIITQPNAIVISASQTNVSCFGFTDGTATVTTTGGTPPFSYSWNTIPVQTSAIATDLKAGNYMVTVTDANNCVNTHTVSITEPSAPLFSSISNSNNVSCSEGNNGNATVNASGGVAPYTYSWNTNPVQTLETATGLIAGTYLVLVTDSNGCTTSSSIKITEPTGINSIITQTNVSCFGDNTGSAKASVTGGIGPYSYSWDTIPVQNSDTATNLKAGTYTVTISDGNTCTISKKVIITEPDIISTSISSQTNVDCIGNNTGAATIIASGGNGSLSYLWNTIPVQTTASATGLIAGNYTVTVTDENDCSKIQNITITQPEAIVITLDLIKDVSCFGNANGSIAISITGGTPNYTYSWTKDGNPYTDNEDLSNLEPGIYEVTVSDAKNCEAKTATFTISEPKILEVNLINNTTIFCFGEATGAITVNVTGGNTPYTFDWTGPNGFTSSTQNLNALLAGTYHLKITDNSGCFVNLAPVTITESTEINIIATTTPIICYGGNDATIQIAISGGVAPYQTTWSNLGSGTFQNNLSSGNYLITVTDALNCFKTLNVIISDPPIFKINPVVKQISCFGANDGSINLNLAGGIAPILLTWSDGSTAGTTRNKLSPGTYSVTIKDNFQCIISKTFTIVEPQPLTLSTITSDALDCDNASSGSINLIVSGGTPPFNYSWSNGSTTEDLMNLTEGNYSVTVTDARGCTKSILNSIKRPQPLTIEINTKTDFDCDSKNIKQTFEAQVSGGLPPYQLNWSNGTVSGSNNELMNTNQNGTVILEVTDKMSCKANYSFDINIPTIGTPDFTTNSYGFTNYGYYSEKEPIQFTNKTTGDYVSLIWDFGDGTFSNELNPIHQYTVSKNYVVKQTVTYPFGCVYTNTINLMIEKGYVLVIPTAFSPNDDGINDIYRPVTKALKNISFAIYDTWGSLIYSEFHAEVLKGWDGKIKGVLSENGNYFCKLSAETFYGTTINENTPFVLIK